jgi:hypothetical protein
MVLKEADRVQKVSLRAKEEDETGDELLSDDELHELTRQYD